jgi:FdhD protein
MGRVTARRRVLQLRGGMRDARVDTLVVEEPLEIRIGGRPLAVTMRTPGDDFDLVLGFLLSEGVIHAREHVASLRYCGSSRSNVGAEADYDCTYNVIDVVLAPGIEPPGAAVERRFYTTSSCGVCGKASLEAVRTSSRWPPVDDPMTVRELVLATLPERLRAGQAVFDRTGGLHAAGVFTAEGRLLSLREDVGRHNAVDKVLGWALREGRLPLHGCVLQVSGRASFELAQKAIMAGIPVLAAVSAPSSLAVDVAAELGLTLIGFLRGQSMNVYTGGGRVVGVPDPETPRL